MRSRLTLTILFIASLPAFSQSFRLELTGGTVIFGIAPMNIAVVSANAGDTNGHLAPTLPPATFSCKPTEAVTLAGAGPFGIRGTTTEFGHLWDVNFVFPGPPGANQGNLTISSTNWELTGKYTMTIRDTVTGAQCSKVVGMSGEYQFAGPGADRVATQLHEADQQHRTIARTRRNHNPPRTRGDLSQICARWRVLRDSRGTGQ